MSLEYNTPINAYKITTFLKHDQIYTLLLKELTKNLSHSLLTT